MIDNNLPAGMNIAAYGTDYILDIRRGTHPEFDDNAYRQLLTTMP